MVRTLFTPLVLFGDRRRPSGTLGDLRGPSGTFSFKSPQHGLPLITAISEACYHFDTIYWCYDAGGEVRGCLRGWMPFDPGAMPQRRRHNGATPTAITDGAADAT